MPCSDRPGSHRIECTGFGFNLLTGNYEFACLIVIDDEDWERRVSRSPGARRRVTEIELCAASAQRTETGDDDSGAES
jgi:hypothetical protein